MSERETANEEPLNLADDGLFATSPREAFFETVVETASEGVLTIDEESRVRYANPAMEDILGYPPEELVGASKMRIIPERLRPLHEAALREYVASGERHLSWDGVELPALHREGHEVPVEISLREHEYQGERLFTGFVRDVSDRVHKEQELQRERDLLEQILDVQPDLFYLFDEDGTFLRWNEQLSTVTGYSDAEIAEMDPLEFIPEADEDRVAAAIDAVFETGETAQVETALVTKAGEEIPHEFTGTRVDGGDGSVIGLAGIGHDVSDRERRERQLREQKDRFEEFASVVSHDLRNPLSVAQGYTELLAEAHPESEADIERIADAHDRIEEMIDELLSLARQGDRVGEPRAVPLESVVDCAWSSVDTGAATLKVRTDATVLADDDRLVQLFENLFRNSVEHAGDDASLTVRVGDLADGFYVEDDGRGIPEDERGSVFDRGETTADDGTGLGLWIVENVVAAHGWDRTLTESADGGVRLEVTGVDLAD